MASEKTEKIWHIPTDESKRVLSAIEKRSW